MTNAVLRVLCTHKSEANCPFSNKRALGWICIGDNLWAKSEKTLGFLSEAGIKGERTVCVKDYKAAVHIMRTPRNRFFKGRWILRASGTLCWGWESRELFPEISFDCCIYPSSLMLTTVIEYLKNLTQKRIFKAILSLTELANIYGVLTVA